MAHERIEIDLPLSKVYESLSNPGYFLHFFERVHYGEKINSKTFKLFSSIGDEEYGWTINVIDNLRNTRFAWITINGDLNQTGTIRYTPLDNGERTRIDFNLDCRTFYGEPEADFAAYIQGLPAQLKKDLGQFKQEVEADTYKQNSEDAIVEAEEARNEEEELQPEEIDEEESDQVENEELPI
jgi:uncharacterized membrane protein